MAGGAVLVAQPATAATGGALKQLAGPKGCLATDPAATACEQVRALQNGGKIAISSDGRSVYVPARGTDAILTFDRDPATGALTQKAGIVGCYTSNAAVSTANSCALVSDTTVLDGVNSATVSPDGLSVYSVANSGRIAVFTRGVDGSLAYQSAVFLTNGPLLDVAVSPDGLNVYAVGTSGGGRMWAMNRTSTSQVTPATFFTPSDVPLMQGGAEVVVTPDGKAVIMSTGNTVCCPWTVINFDRATTGTVGSLTPPSTASDCVTGNPTPPAGCTQIRPGMSYPRGLILADNGSRLFVAGYDAIVTINRNPADNALAPNAAGGCATYAGGGYAGCAEVGPISSLYPARTVLALPNGESLYFATESATPTLYAATRDGGGSFALKPAPTGCLTPAGSAPCGLFRAGNRVESMVADAQSRHVYVAGDQRLFSFAVDRPPTCSNVAATAPHNTTAAVLLSCSDLDGDALTYEIVTAPAKGVLGAVQPDGAVNYGPLVGTSGTDTFTFRAVAFGTRSDPATATVEVAGPPDTRSPNTTITAGPSRRTQARRASFRFRSNEAGSTFQCKLDRGPFRACKSPKAYRGMKKGTHTFRVRARDAAGNLDRTPAKRTWRIL